MPRIVHFEIPCDNGQRSRDFYQKVFGWRVEGWGDEPTYQLAYTGEEGPGINGALYQRQSPDLGVLVYVEVPAIDDHLAQAQEAGAGVVLAKMPIPGVGWSAVIRDPEGNRLGLFQSDESAPAAT